MNPPTHVRLRLTLAVIAATATVCASALLGYLPLDWSDVARGPFQQQQTSPFWDLRVPRTALAGVAGAALAIGGVILQALFRNPLATPYTLGLAGGASLGAATLHLLGLGGYVLGLPRLSLAAFGGAIASMLLVYGIARRDAGRDVGRLLLAGVSISFLCSAGVMLVVYLAEGSVTNRIVIWMMGSLSVYRPRAAVECAVVLVAVLAYLLAAHRALDLVAMGEDVAASRGVAVGRVVWSSFLLVGLLTAVVVSNCGPIGFIGLMAPHVARQFFGVRMLPLAIGAAALGAAFLAACDAGARSLRFELPVGVITNVVGAGFFIYLLSARRSALTVAT